MIQKDTIKTSKTSTFFECEHCHFKCSKMGDWNRHILRAKHLNNVQKDTKDTKKHQKTSTHSSYEYVCDCGNIYKHHSGLWRHKKLGICCKMVNNSEPPTDKDQLILMLIKQNSDLVKETSEFKIMMMKVLENGTHNTNINSNNKAFNLNLFLNETCKDAMNIMDFVESIKLQVTDLERIGEVGYVEGISDIIVSNLNKLDITQRPIHCTDKKRETMYVKDAGKWEKDETTNLIRKAIRKVTHNNQRLLPQFKEKYPDFHNSYSSHSDKVTKVVIETMVNNIPDKEEKIIRNIAKSVVLDKTHSL